MASTATKTYQYLVIGGGSGGIASARRAAMYGAQVGLVEGSSMGGTCVNLGCVPKKIMYNAAVHAEALHDAASYGFNTAPATFDLAVLKEKRDAYIHRLNGIYNTNLDKSGVTVHQGFAKFVGPKTVQVGEEIISGEHVLIAVGGVPSMPSIPGIEHCISSDGIFDFKQIPAKAAVVGAGYIAVEMAGILQSLGSEVSMFIRGNHVLRTFDPDISETITSQMETIGLKFHRESQVAAVHKDDSDKLTLTLKDGSTVGGFDVCLMAIGRHARTAQLDLEKAGVETRQGGHIIADEFQNTSAPGVYAIGDVTGIAELTPVAIAAGRRLAARLFNGQTDLKLDYSNIPTVVFSHPSPIGTCGLTTPQANEKYGAENIKVYTSRFTNMFYSMMTRKPVSLIKLIVHIPSDKVLGLHIIGMGADEMLQGFGVAIKMGATKKDFDSCVAIHPTAAEEVVTLV